VTSCSTKDIILILDIGFRKFVDIVCSASEFFSRDRKRSARNAPGYEEGRVTLPIFASSRGHLILSDPRWGVLINKIARVESRIEP
jgi:hypothetical protein